MRLWYHSWDSSLGRYVIGMATSPDGFKWTKKGVVFDPVKAAAGSGSVPVHDVLGASAHYIVSNHCLSRGHANRRSFDCR